MRVGRRRGSAVHPRAPKSASVGHMSVTVVALMNSEQDPPEPASSDGSTAAGCNKCRRADERNGPRQRRPTSSPPAAAAMSGPATSQLIHGFFSRVAQLHIWSFAVPPSGDAQNNRRSARLESMHDHRPPVARAAGICATGQRTSGLLTTSSHPD